jgi:hypothetical protein
MRRRRPQGRWLCCGRWVVAELQGCLVGQGRLVCVTFAVVDVCVTCRTKDGSAAAGECLFELHWHGSCCYVLGCKGGWFMCVTRAVEQVQARSQAAADAVQGSSQGVGKGSCCGSH